MGSVEYTTRDRSWTALSKRRTSNDALLLAAPYGMDILPYHSASLLPRERLPQHRLEPVGLLGSSLVSAASENGPDVDSGGRSYRLLSLAGPTIVRVQPEVGPIR